MLKFPAPSDPSRDPVKVPVVVVVKVNCAMMSCVCAMGANGSPPPSWLAATVSVPVFSPVLTYS